MICDIMEYLVVKKLEAGKENSAKFEKLYAISDEIFFLLHLL